MGWVITPVILKNARVKTIPMIANKAIKIRPKNAKKFFTSVLPY
jgi:hypothetical protein